MNEHHEPDPLAELSAADPVDADRLSSASLARIRARVREEAMSDAAARPGQGRRVRRVGAWAGIAVAAAVIAIVALGGRGMAPGLVPDPSGSGSGGPVVGSCVEPYTDAALTHRGFAFDGTVAAIAGDQVTFTVHHAYRGIDGGSVSLRAPGMTGGSTISIGGLTLEPGGRYLVAGDDPFVWACGYTQPYDAAVAAAWSAILGG